MGLELQRLLPAFNYRIDETTDLDISRVVSHSN